MIEQNLLTAGGGIFLFLGFVHFIYAFFTNKFLPCEEDTLNRMKSDYPRMSKDKTMWQGLSGFNGSHSAGMMFIGAINLIFAIQYFDFYQAAQSIVILNAVTALFYLFLAFKYWVKIPIVGITVSTICVVVSSILILT